MDFPVTIPLEVSRGESVEFDRFGNEVVRQSPFETVLVFAWSVSPVEEVRGDSVMRVVDKLKVILPPDSAPGPSGRFRTPDGVVWQVDGGTRDPNNNPWWSPGLVVVMGEAVSG